MFDGNPLNINWNAIFLIPIQFVKKIEDNILRSINYLAEEAYELHLESKKSLWIKEFIQELKDLNK